MKRVYICSRYKGDEKRSVEENIQEALAGCAYALKNGYAPFASHLLYPRCLDDSKVEERELGMKAGLAWIDICDEVWQWGAFVSEGMKKELEYAKSKGKVVKKFCGQIVEKEKEAFVEK